jgi:hypothetical protein
MDIWLTIQLIFPTFWLSSPFFPHFFEHDLDYIILQLQVSFDAYAHISLTLWVSTSYIVFITMNAHEPMMYSSYQFCCHYAKCWLPCGMKTTTCVSFNHVQLLSSTIQNCVHQRWHLHFNQHCHYQPNMSIFTFPTLHKDLLSLMWLKPKKRTIVINTPQMNSSL